VKNVTGGRRERKKHATSVALQEAALRLFRAQGFAATTVEEIAEAADVSTRTFFRHFHSKEAVLFSDDADRHERWVEVLEARPADEPILQTLREASREMAADYGDEVVALRWELGAREGRITSHLMRTATEWEHLVATEVARRLGLASSYELPARLTAAVASAAWRIAQTRWVREHGAHPLETHLDEAFDALDRITSSTPVVDLRNDRNDRSTDEKVRPLR
jgi:AcrR family transcriptional regulator